MFFLQCGQNGLQMMLSVGVDYSLELMMILKHFFEVVLAPIHLYQRLRSANKEAARLHRFEEVLTEAVGSDECSLGCVEKGTLV